MHERTYYGGQAVIEGVMMRGKKNLVTAVRRPGGDLTMNIQKLSRLYTSHLRKIPLARGVIVLIEAMVLGIKSLMYSANVALEEEETQISGGTSFAILGGSLTFSVALFFLAPLFLTRLIDPYISSSLVFHIIEGLVRLAIFVAYLTIISMMPDIKRIFAYHGAEHKTVNAYEDGVPLELEAVKLHSTAHVRCGTSFLFVVLIIAIVVFALIGRPSLLIMILSRIVLIPVIAGLGYEVTYFAGRHTNNFLVRTILAPGLWLQNLTTREPEDDQVEVAIAALSKVIELDQDEDLAEDNSG